MGFGGPSRGQSIYDWVREATTASQYGGSASNPEQLSMSTARWGQNMISGGDVESFSAGASAAPDGFTLSGAGASAARESTIVKYGTYSAKVTRAGTDCKIAQTLVATAGGTTYFRGRVYTLSVWAYATVADRVRIAINDGTGSFYSTYHPGDSVWRLLSVTRTIALTGTQISAECWVDTGNTSGYFDAILLMEGAGSTAFSENPNDRNLRVSNFQDTTPTNSGEVGLWRMEVGRASLAGDTAQSNVTKTITYATAFRTVRAVLLGGREVVGLRRCVWRADTEGASTFILRAETPEDPGDLFADTSSGTCSWAVMGNV